MVGFCQHLPNFPFIKKENLVGVDQNAPYYDIKSLTFRFIRSLLIGFMLKPSLNSTLYFRI